MKEVWVNHKLVDFLNAIRQEKITPGCGLIQEEEQQQQQRHQHEQQPHIEDSDEYVREHIMEDSESDQVLVPNTDLCVNNKCKHGGKCIPQPPSDYICKCTSPWSGKFCDQGNLE